MIIHKADCPLRGDKWQTLISDTDEQIGAGYELQYGHACLSVTAIRIDGKTRLSLGNGLQIRFCPLCGEPNK